jgi:hypothetical protein
LGQAWEINLAASKVTLDSTRRGTLRFQVFNTSGRPLRGRVTVAPTSAATEAWLSLEGQVQSDYSVGETQQYTITISAPAEAPSGTYGFHVYVVGLTNPDEEYAKSPLIAFDIPAVPGLPWALGQIPWRILAIAALAVVSGIAVYLLLRGS